MKKLLNVLLLSGALFMAVAPGFLPASQYTIIDATQSMFINTALADDAAPAAETAPSEQNPSEPGDISGDEVALLVKSLGGLKGGGALAIAYAIVQLLLLILKAKLVKLSPGLMLSLVYGLNTAFGVLSLVIVGGLSFSAALVHSQTLAAASVFINQVFKKAKAA